MKWIAGSKRFFFGTTGKNAFGLPNSCMGTVPADGMHFGGGRGLAVRGSWDGFRMDLGSSPVIHGCRRASAAVNLLLGSM